LPVGRDDRFGVVAGSGGQLLEVGAVGVGGEDVVARIDAPDVAFGVVGPGRAVGAAEVGGGVQDLFAVGIEVRAGGAALAGRDHVLIAAVGVHDEDLVAFQRVAVGLEDELLAVGGEVGLCVLSAEGELADVVEVLFGLGGGGRRCAGGVLRRGGEKGGCKGKHG